MKRGKGDGMNLHTRKTFELSSEEVMQIVKRFALEQGVDVSDCHKLQSIDVSGGSVFVIMTGMGWVKKDGAHEETVNEGK